MDQVRVLIVADDPLVRAGLTALLADEPGCVVVGQVISDADLSGELISEETRALYQPDVALWDLGWDPALVPVAVSDRQQAGGAEPAEVPAVALVSGDAAWTVSVADAWAAGARGFLLRDVEAEELAAALLAVAQGLVVLDPTLAGAVMPLQGLASAQLVEELSSRELEVLQLLAEGLPNKAIGYQLGISEHTVKFHVNAILGKLGVQSRTEAVVQATRLGLIIL
jgi:DNA-binding NarL/FixJ family response regulator